MGRLLRCRSALWLSDGGILATMPLEILTITFNLLNFSNFSVNYAEQLRRKNIPATRLLFKRLLSKFTSSSTLAVISGWAFGRCQCVVYAYPRTPLAPLDNDQGPGACSWPFLRGVGEGAPRRNRTQELRRSRAPKLHGGTIKTRRGGEMWGAQAAQPSPPLRAASP